MLVGVLVLVVASWLGGDISVSGAAIFIIGVIPIIAGFCPYGFFAVLIASILTIIGFAVFVWMRKQASRA